MLNPAQRIRAIQMSLRCFVYGWLSLLPLIGLPASIVAIGLHFRTMAVCGGEWNPAKRYLVVGYCLAWLGLLITVGAGTGILIGALNHS